MARKGLRGQRLATVLLVGAVVALGAVDMLRPVPALAQGSVWDSFFEPFPNRGQPRPEQRAAPVESSRAPAPLRRAEPATSHVLVLGDSMADWLAYGLEDALGETPEFGVTRKHRTYSGLLRYEPRAETPDWAQAAREIMAAEKPNFIVMMVGLNDRQSIRERVVAPARGAAAQRPAAPAGETAAQPAQPPEHDTEKPNEPGNPKQPSILAPEAPRGPRVAGTHEFRTDKWAELYSKKIDDTIAALKGRGGPVLWVGVPSVRGQRSTSGMVYLNELDRPRAVAHLQRAGEAPRRKQPKAAVDPLPKQAADQGLAVVLDRIRRAVPREIRQHCGGQLQHRPHAEYARGWLNGARSAPASPWRRARPGPEASSSRLPAPAPVRGLPGFPARSPTTAGT